MGAIGFGSRSFGTVVEDPMAMGLLGPQVFGVVAVESTVPLLSPLVGIIFDIFLVVPSALSISLGVASRIGYFNNFLHPWPGSLEVASLPSELKKLIIFLSADIFVQIFDEDLFGDGLVVGLMQQLMHELRVQPFSCFFSGLLQFIFCCFFTDERGGMLAVVAAVFGFVIEHSKLNDRYLDLINKSNQPYSRSSLKRSPALLRRHPPLRLVLLFLRVQKTVQPLGLLLVQIQAYLDTTLRVFPARLVVVLRLNVVGVAGVLLDPLQDVSMMLQAILYLL